MDIEKSVALAKQGNKQELNNLIISFEPLIKSIASNKCSTLVGADLEDAMQEGRSGFYKAIESYNQSKTANFATYAKKVVENELVSYTRKIISKTNSLNTFGIPLNEETEILGSFNSAETEYLNNEHLQDLLNEFKEDLSLFEKNILDLKIAGFSCEEMAKSLSKTKKSVDNALARIKSKINIKREK